MVKADPAMLKLAAQYSKARAKLAAQGGSVPSQHPSLIGRVFDVLSRPNYAVANTFKAVVDKINENKAQNKGGNIAQLPGLLSGGFWTGLEGKNKTHFADVFSAGGVKNPIVRAVAGIGADVALDPSSYIGAGVVKAVPEIERARAAAEAVQQAYGAGTKASTLATVAQTARKAAEEAKPGALQLKIAGRPVVQSQRAYQALATVGRPIAQSGPVDTARRLLSNSATFTGGLNSTRRAMEQAGISNYLRTEKDFMAAVRKITPEEGARVARDTELGLDLTGQISQHGVDLGDLQKRWLDIKNHYDTVERQFGVYRPGQGIDNYIPKKFASTGEYNSAEAIAFRRSEEAKMGALKAGKQVTFPTFADVKAMGLHPHENLVDIARLRAIEGERAIAKAGWKNEAIDRFGFSFDGPGTKAATNTIKQQGLVKLDGKFLKNTLHEGRDVYVPKDVARSFESLDRIYTSSEESRKFIKLTDDLTRYWKTGVTTINPSHHLRNMAGDAFQNWEAGVRDPLDYKRGLQVIRRDGKIKVGGHMLDATDLNDWYHLSGGASGFFNAELVGTNPAGQFGKITEPLNRAQERLRSVVANREDFMRLANWTHAVREYADTHAFNGLQDMEKAAKYATERVKKFNFDYGDLTHFETNVRRFVPFYTFMRKNIPLQLEMLALHPGQMSQIPKGFNAVQQLLGTDSGHLPVGEIVPSFIKDLGAVRIRGESDKHNALYADPQLPIAQAAQLLTGSPHDIIRRAIGQTVLRPAYELGSQTSALTGQPISGSPVQYAVNQFPWTRTAQEILKPHKPNRVIQPREKFGNTGLRLLDLINPVGIREITPQAERSELQRRLDPVQARLRAQRNKRINAALRGGSDE